MKTFGLLGYPLGHSFSKKYFTEKFEREELNDHEYVNFELDSIDRFPEILDYKNEVYGLNCTIPYKQQVMQYLDDIDDEAFEVGAVNTIKFVREESGRIELIGYNTDIIGFENSLIPMLTEKHRKALILGTGGASKAVKHVLKKNNIDFVSASIEELGENEISYDAIDEAMIKDRLIIINATPLGTFPKVEACPDIPYDALTPDHVLFDLVYNPEITTFMSKGIEKGASVKNGLEMLHGQAEAAWKIWNED
ncbi:shikimate dehydrogenase family protein [Saccharicrinis sp. FJH54]|uniref:shikimate dehydrogenase family protein n=1 Tax=Saccharicrinis sp. FJH54 TaxID=3344665 RepID=UPI0035D3F117